MQETHKKQIAKLKNDLKEEIYKNTQEQAKLKQLILIYNQKIIK
jgi:hypothetical protein